MDYKWEMKKMENKRTEVCLVLVMVLSLFVIAPIPACAEQPSSVVTISNISVPQGATTTVPIMITSATNGLSCAQIDLTYDSTVVQVTNVGNSSFDHFYPNIDAENETVKMVGFQGGGSLDAPTKFADVTLKAVGSAGSNTSLNLEGRTYMGSGSPYGNITMGSGSGTITVAVPVYNIFGMIALIGLLAIVLAVTVRRR